MLSSCCSKMISCYISNDNINILPQVERSRASKKEIFKKDTNENEFGFCSFSLAVGM